MPGRALVTMLFCDLVGSTSLMTRLGDEASDIVRRDVFTALRRPVEVHGGDEVKSQGDGLMIAFHGHPSDAVTCAVAMQLAVFGLDRNQPLLGLALRVGVSAGEATSEDGDWFGTPVVEAARLCSAAASGQVLVAESVFGARTNSDTTAYESVGALDLKGFPEPRPAWSVVVPQPPSDVAVLPPGLDPSGEARFEYRANERERVVEAISRSADGEPQLVLIAGDAGAGKTRLAAEIGRDAMAGGAAVLYGCVRDERDPPLAAVVDALRWYLTTRQPPTVPLNDGASGLVDTLVQAGEGAPVVVVLDDLHRAPGPLLALVAEIAERPVPCRVTVIGLVRERSGEGDGNALRRLLAKLEGSSRVEVVRLEPLPLDATATLLAPAAPGVVRAVHRETGGNPGLVIEARRRLLAANAMDDADKARAALARASPYRGLAAFDVDDHDLFFGRDQLIDSLFDRLEQSRFLAVVGASGSGKSSLVRAGLLARFDDVKVMTPGSRPSVDAIPTDDSVLFVDQLEECFTLCDDERLRNAFFDGLLDAASTPSGPSVVVALRADFVGHAASHVRLAAMLETTTALLAPMSEAELQDAIERPAAMVGLRLEPGLCDVVLADIHGEPGGLPLFSHALLETWRRRRGRMLTIADYREAGGAKGAIARTADRVYTERLTPDEQVLARATFLRLTELGERTEDTRRRVSRRELATLGDTAAIDRVSAVLVDARLIVTEDGYVEVAHEALIREWPRLRGWLDDNREAIRVHHDLRRASGQWAAAGRPVSDLYRGARLDAALRLTESDVVALNADERAFVNASAAARDRDLTELEARAKAQARSNKRLRWLLSAAVIALVLTVVASTLAVTQRNRADSQARVALDRARIATARGLAVRAGSADLPPDVALLLAVAARHLDDSPDTEAALAGALLRRSQLVGFVRPPTERYTHVAALPGGGGVATTGHGIDRWTASDPRPVHFADDLQPHRLAVSGDGGLVAVANTDGSVRVLRITDGTTIWTSPSSEGVAGYALAISPDGRQVVADYGSHQVVYDVATGIPVGPPIGVDTPQQVEFGPGPGQLTTQGPDDRMSGQAELASWDIATGAKLSTHYTAGFNWFAVGGGHIAIGTESGTELLDPTTDMPLQAPGAGSTTQPDVASSTQTSSTPQAGGPANATQSGGTSTPPAGAQLTKLNPPVALAPDGNEVIGVQPGLSTEVVIARLGAPAITIQPGIGQIFGVSVSPDGSTLLINGNVVAVWSLRNTGSLVQQSYGPESLAANGALPPGSTVTGALSPDGTRLVLTSRYSGLQSTSRVLDAGTEAPISPLIDGVARFIDDDSLLAVTKSTAKFSPTVVQRLRVSDGSQISAPIDLGPSSSEGIAVNPSKDGFAVSNGQMVQVASIGPENQIMLRTLIAGNPTELISGLAYSADGAHLAVTDANSLSVYTVPDWRLLGVAGLAAHVAQSAATFSPDGKLLAVGTGEGPVVLLDVTTLEPVGPALDGHSGPVAEVRFSPDGSRLASLGSDSTVRVWDVAGTRLVGQPLPSASPVDLYFENTLSFSNDGRLLFAPTMNGLSAWDIDPRDWDAIACRIAGRNLTQDEWNTYLPPGTPYRQTCPAH